MHTCAVEAIAIGIDLAQGRQRCQTARIVLVHALFRQGGGVSLARVGVGQGSVQRGGALVQPGVARELGCQRVEDRRGRLEARAPAGGLREKAGGQRMLLRQPDPVRLARRAAGEDHARNLGIEPPGAGERGEELRGERRVLEPVTAQQRVARRRIRVSRVSYAERRFLTNIR